jgi:hypothetical protein
MLLPILTPSPISEPHRLAWSAKNDHIAEYGVESSEARDQSQRDEQAITIWKTEQWEAIKKSP